MTPLPVPYTGITWSKVTLAPMPLINKQMRFAPRSDLCTEELHFVATSELRPPQKKGHFLQYPKSPTVRLQCLLASEIRLQLRALYNSVTGGFNNGFYY